MMDGAAESRSRYRRKPQNRSAQAMTSAAQVLPMNRTPSVLAAALCAAQAAAGMPSTAPPLILRTNTYGGTIATGPRSTEFVQYASLNDLSSGVTSGMPNIDFADHAVNDIFWDGTRFYRTDQDGGKYRIQSWSSLEDYGDESKVWYNNLSTTWSAADDFWCDQSGNFYRSSTANNLTIGVTKYSNFMNLVNDNAGVYTQFATGFRLDDRFWCYGGKFYKTTVGFNLDVDAIVAYASLEALAANIEESREGMMTPYGTLDTFVFISLPGAGVPAPGAIALLGMAGLLGTRRRR